MRVHAIQTGTVRIKTAQLSARRPAPGALLDVITDRNWTGWVPTFAWAIETDDGVIVVDTGQATYLLDEVKHSPHPFIRTSASFQIEREQEIGPQLKVLGIGPRDVTQVVLTHMHMDHDAGLSDFPETPIFAAPGEIKRSRGIAGMIGGYLPQRWPSWFDPKGLVLSDGPYGPFAASKKLTRDGRVRAVATPGHTPEHMSVIVEEDGQSLFIAGDTSYTEALMLQDAVDGVSPDQAVTRRTLAAIRQFASERPTVYLPTHDPDSGARFAERRTVVVPTKMKGAA